MRSIFRRFSARRPPQPKAPALGDAPRCAIAAAIECRSSVVLARGAARAPVRRRSPRRPPSLGCSTERAVRARSGRARSCPSTFPTWVPLTTKTCTPAAQSASTRVRTLLASDCRSGTAVPSQSSTIASKVSSITSCARNAGADFEAGARRPLSNGALPRREVRLPPRHPQAERRARLEALVMSTHGRVRSLPPPRSIDSEVGEMANDGIGARSLGELVPSRSQASPSLSVSLESSCGSDCSVTCAARSFATSTERSSRTSFRSDRLA
jgi:hypothetical protein